MDDTRSDEERLPWLHAPRRPKSAPRTTGTAKPRRSDTPLFVLLSLFMLAGIGVIAFLAGRGSVPIGPIATRPEPAPPREARVNLPPAIAPSVAPAPASAPELAPSLARAAAPKPKRVAATSLRPVKARSVSISKKSVARITPRARSAAAKITSDARRRAARRARYAPRYVYVAQPSPAKPGRVIQLGVYYDPRHADAAWRRVVIAYPYLGKLPKAVVPARGMANQPVYYRLQLGTRSRRDARILCRNLLSIGRGCRVV
jgi:hypothetical protein